MAAVRWDQRAVASVTVQGTVTDQKLFTDSVDEQGWLVVESHVPTGLSTLTAGYARYTVEVRFPGSAYRAVSGARQRLEVLAEHLKLELTVTAVDLVRGEPDLRPHWTVYRPAAGPPTPVGSGRLELLRRRVAETRGTGRQTRANTEAQALALARWPLPGTAATPADARVRPSWREASGLGRHPGGPRRHLLAGLSHCMIVLLAVGVAVTQNDHTSVAQARFWFFLLVALGAVTVAAIRLRRNRPGMPPAGLVLTLAVIGAGSFLTGANMGWAFEAYAPDVFSGGYALLILLTGLFILRGLSLLFRTAPLRSTLPWLLPALLPFIPGLVPSVGLWQTTLYLNELHVDVEDIQIPAWDQFQSTLAVLGAMSLWLLAPALLGLAQHLHLMIRERWMAYTAFALLSVWCLLIGAWQFAYLPAVNAGMEAANAASSETDAPGGFGVAPEWVCVLPIDAAEKVPADGGRLDPEQPYLKIGDADGTAVLASAAEQPLKIRLSAVRLIPIGEAPGSHTCTEFMAFR
ncbi:hypothetical protein [Streptomyces sp. NPDC057280]|uniref:hypothetical protein n=1 Tax=Streptomyces sp. NPDC057280 TaxID=3346081 RepID=UPI003645514D